MRETFALSDMMTTVGASCLQLLASILSCVLVVKLVVGRDSGTSKLRYQTHRGIDGAYGVIMATVLGAGDESETHRFAMNQVSPVQSFESWLVLLL